MRELDVARVRRWCRGRVPPHQCHEVRVECDVTARHLTILQCRVVRPDGGAEAWIREPLARLRYTASLQEWTLYWRDSSQKFRRYGMLPPTRHVEELLAELDADPACLFWG